MDNLSFALDRGSQSTAWIAAPGRASTGFVVLPGLGIEARYYKRVLDAFCAQGCAAAVVEARGVGSSLPRPSRQHDHDYLTRIEDLTVSLDHVLPMLGARRVILVGHSMGGQIALLHAALRAEKPYAAIALVASVMPYFRGFPGHSWSMLARTQLVGASARVLGYFPGHKLGFAGREARSLMVEWSRTARHGRYVLRGHDQSRALAAVSLPVLSITLAGDAFAPVAAVEHVRHTLAHAQHTFHHEIGTGRSVDHNRWPREPEAIVKRIVAWAQGL